jgi:hypothetical protein
MEKPLHVSPSANKPNEPLVQPIHISGSLALNDCLAAIKLLRGGHDYLFLLIFSISIISIEFGILRYILTKHQLKLTMITSLAAFLIFVAVLRGIKFRSLKKAFIKCEGLFASTENIISEDSYITQQESMENNIPWSVFKYYRITDRVALLVQPMTLKKISFTIVPRSKFKSPEDWKCFIGLLDRKLPRS